MSILVNPQDYAGKRADGHCGMKCGTVVKIADTFVCDSHFFTLKAPSTMSIELSAERAVLNEPIDVKIVFTNPNSFNLTGIRLHYEGSGLLQHDEIINIRGYLEPGSSKEFKVTLRPYRSGQKNLLVVVTSNEAPEYKAEKEIYVSYGE